MYYIWQKLPYTILMAFGKLFYAVILLMLIVCGWIVTRLENEICSKTYDYYYSLYVLCISVHSGNKKRYNPKYCKVWLLNNLIYTTYHWCKIPIWKVIEYLWSVIVVVSLTVPRKNIEIWLCRKRNQNYTQE